MKKKALGVFITCIISFSAHAQGLESLTDKVASVLLDAFSGSFNVKSAVVRFENRSGQTDRAAQNFYQLLVAKLEVQKTIHFRDLMIAFENGSGEFNLNNIQDLNYLISIKLINNRGKLGAGWAIFSKTLDRVVNMGFLESQIETGERSMLEVVDLGFKSLGFFREVEIDVGPSLLDLKTLQIPEGGSRYFLYYSDRIEMHRLTGSRLDRVTTLALTWGRPYYPAIEQEGTLLVFLDAGKLFVTAGSNVSETAKVFVLSGDEWREGTPLRFVPFRLIEFNDQLYLAGSRYMPGRNYFLDRILLAPLAEGGLGGSDFLEKQVPHFYALDFATAGNELESIHIIDRQYRYRFFASDFIERANDEEKRGGDLAALDDQWLAMTDHTTGKDTLFFFKITNGSRRLVYQNGLEGEVVFLTAGRWKANTGFWVYVKMTKKHGAEYRLQFWHKPSLTEPESVPSADEARGESQNES